MTMQSFKKLKIMKGVLVRETKRGVQIVLPTKYHHLVYTELHENMAHLGGRSGYRFSPAAVLLGTYVQGYYPVYSKKM